MFGKNTKTLLFVSLITALILSFSILDSANAKTDEKSLKDSIKDIGTYLSNDIQTIQFDQTWNIITSVGNTIGNDIPDDKILKRDYKEWKNQYESYEDFYKYNRAIEGYVSLEITNKWNETMIKEQIRIHNFDTIIGQKAAGLQAMLSDVQNQKDSMTYNPTEAERRYHDWAMDKYPDFDISSEIDLGMIKQVVKSHNNIANHGNVPVEIVIEDPIFWIMTANDTMCSYGYCEHDNDLFTSLANTVMPPAYAISVWHVMNGYMGFYECEGTGGACLYAIDTQRGYGTLSTSVTTPEMGHGYGAKAMIWGTNCSPDDSSATNSISGDLILSLEFHYEDIHVGDCAVIFEISSIAHSPRAYHHGTLFLNSDSTV